MAEALQYILTVPDVDGHATLQDYMNVSCAFEYRQEAPALGTSLALGRGSRLETILSTRGSAAWQSPCALQGRNSMCATGQEDWDPYWARPWPSAAALAARLLQSNELVAAKAVAELGAGLGLAGLAAALAGVSRLRSIKVAAH